MAGQGLRARPLRTTLAALSLVIGIVAVVCVWTASAVAERAVVARAELESGRAGTYTMTIPDAPEALDAVRTVVSDSSGAAVIVPTSGALGTDPDVALRLVGVAGDLRAIRPFPLSSGGWLNSNRAASRAPHLVLNQRAAEQVGRGMIASTLRLGTSNTFRPVLVGVVDDGSGEPTAYVRLDELLNLDPTLSTTTEAQALFTGDTSAAAITAQARLRAMGATVEPLSRVTAVEELRQSVATIRTIFAFVAAVALVVGGLAVLNIGLATIGERVDELALRRAVGARARLLATVVLLESAAVGIIAAGLALAISVPLLRPATFALFEVLPRDTVIGFPWTAALAAASSGCVASLLGGLAPAVRAARIPISRVMRA
ncbi:MAG: ABC transporter permease [Dermatophilaceae bacterium]